MGYRFCACPAWQKQLRHNGDSTLKSLTSISGVFSPLLAFPPKILKCQLTGNACFRLMLIEVLLHAFFAYHSLEA